MARTSARKNGTQARRSIRWSKQYLLPMPNEYVRQLSLKHHLALAGCKREEGNRHLFNELIRTTYIAFYLWDAGIGDANLDLFRGAEATLDRAVVQAEQTNIWRLEIGDEAVMSEILCLHDSQIASVSARIFLESRARLDPSRYTEVS